MFSSPEQSHAHSLSTLELLYEYDDFMRSINTLVDFGCGTGQDLEWWATRTTRDEVPVPLNINCVGIDQLPYLNMAQRYRNIQYHPQDFEDTVVLQKRTYDVAWCHDAFQYATNPLATLANWWHAISENGMLVITVPQTTNIEYSSQAFDQPSGCYFNWTLVSLIHALSVSGFDCASGFFNKGIDDPWLTAAVYRSNHPPRVPAKTTWYMLAEAGLLPVSAVVSIDRHGYLRQRDLQLPWLDKSITWYGKH